MKVGILSYDFAPPIGGLGVVSKQYRDGLKERFPHDAFIVLSPSPESDDRTGRFAASCWRKPGGCPFFSLTLLWKLASLIRKHDLGLLHVHAGSGGVFLLRTPEVPTVVTVHHTYLQEAEIVFRKRPLKRLWKFLMSLLERRTYRIADRVLCVSADTADALVQGYGIDRRKIEVLENPVDDRCFGESSPPVTKRASTILFLGRLEERKGIATLLRAFQMIAPEIPDARLELVGENLLGTSLDRWIERLGLGDRVTYLGHVHDPMRFRELRSAAVVVVPSILEGFGLVAAEAMAVGACVIASDAPGLRSLIKDGITGLVFPVGNAEALAKDLRRVLTDERLKTSLALAAADEAKRRFVLTEQARELHRVLSDVIASR